MSTSHHQGMPSWLRYGVPGALVIVACGLYVYVNSGESAPPQPKSGTASADMILGPGALGSADSGESLNKREAPEVANPPPNGLAAGPDGQLLVTPGLHDVFDYFLLQQAGGNQARALQAYLKSQLPAATYTQAQDLADRYQSYMQAHDALLASQNLGTGDAERIASWREQRDRLRLGMLGENVVRIWYQNDDDRFAQAIDQLRQRGAAARPAGAGQQEDDQTLSVIADQTKSYAIRRQEEQTWAAHFQTYFTAATQIKQQTGLSFAERESRLRAELVKLFPSESQRQRARDLGP